ncbi:MAG: carbamate kinase [Pirellulaceae bacterium]|nr:carbamate kinase [Pirellulaceae bacterium]
MDRVVAVLGGNAFAPSDGPMTMQGQIEFAHRAAEQLMPLLAEDTQLLISHGNGPQVGHILRRVEAALGQSYRLPLDVCVAESEGELGFVLGQALRNVVQEHGVSRGVISLLTQVEVRADDPAFDQPSKPIGPFLDHERAEQLRATGSHVVEDAGRGYRRVVPSPKPHRIIELDAIRVLLETGQIVVAGGGGGIPVVSKSGRLVGIEAVIDKDWTAALMADQLDAEMLVILTCVPCAYLFFNTDQQQAISQVTPAQLKTWLDEGHFAPGSMRPKVEAVIQFASKPDRRAIICDVESLPAALVGGAGTIVKGLPSSQVA